MNINTHEIEELLVKSKAGDAIYLQELVHAIKPDLDKYVELYLSQTKDAGEVSQAVINQIPQYLPTFQNVDMFGIWLKDMAFYLCEQKLKTYAPGDQIIYEDENTPKMLVEEVNGSIDLNEEDIEDLIYRVLGNIDIGERVVTLASYCANQNPLTIAQNWNTSVPAVLSTLQKAQLHIQNLLRPYTITFTQFVKHLQDYVNSLLSVSQANSQIEVRNSQENTLHLNQTKVLEAIKEETKQPIKQKKVKRKVKPGGLIALALLLGLGCFGLYKIFFSKPKDEVIIVQPSTSEEPGTTIHEIAWVVEPSISADFLREIDSTDDYDSISNYQEVVGEMGTFRDYDTDVITLYKNNLVYLINYDGSLVSEVPFVSSPNYAFTLSQDKSSLILNTNMQGWGYNISKHFDSFSQIESSTNLPPEYMPYVENGHLYQVQPISDNGTYTEEIADITGKAKYSSRMSFFVRNTNDRAVVDSQGNILFTYPSQINYDVFTHTMPLFVNGFVVSSSDAISYTFINAETGNPINDEQYENLKYFIDGYAPVKKNGAWGYIDTNGNLVVDYVFEDASVLHDGKAIVKYGGHYGILDFKETFANDSFIIGSQDLPTKLIENKLLTDYPQLEIVKDCPTYQEVDGEQFSQAYSGQFYPILDTSKDEDYIWYQVGTNTWIKDDPSDTVVELQGEIKE